jgi:CheY-like chemotaxis protein
MERIVSLTEKLIDELRAHRKKLDLKHIPRMLVVEDDSADACLIGRTLSAMGALVDTAFDGEDAVTKIREVAAGLRQAYLIVFLDLNLPKISGVHVLEELRKLTPDTPVIVVTGAVYESHNLEEASRIGYFGLVKKPLSKTDAAEIFAKHRIQLDPPDSADPSDKRNFHPHEHVPGGNCPGCGTKATGFCVEPRITA